MEENDDRGRRGNVWVLLRQAWRRGWSCGEWYTPEAEDDKATAASGTCGRGCWCCPHGHRCWSSLLLLPLLVRVLLLLVRRRTSIACLGRERRAMTWMSDGDEVWLVVLKMGPI